MLLVPYYTSQGTTDKEMVVLLLFCNATAAAGCRSKKYDDSLFMNDVVRSEVYSKQLLSAMNSTNQEI